MLWWGELGIPFYLLSPNRKVGRDSTVTARLHTEIRPQFPGHLSGLEDASLEQHLPNGRECLAGRPSGINEAPSVEVSALFHPKNCCLIAARNASSPSCRRAASCGLPTCGSAAGEVPADPNSMVRCPPAAAGTGRSVGPTASDSYMR